MSVLLTVNIVSKRKQCRAITVDIGVHGQPWRRRLLCGCFCCYCWCCISL